MLAHSCTYGWVITGRGAKPCHCELNKQFSSREAKAEIPKRYLNCSIENFTPQGATDSDQYTSQLKALSIAKRTIKEFPTQGILLTGNCGTGKTHLAVAILRALLQKGVAGIFCDVSQLLSNIQSTWNPNSPSTSMDVLTPISTTPILVLDEIGAGKITEWSRDIIAQIINQRYNNDLFTIITTNYTDDGPQTLTDRIGERSRSRLHQMTKAVHIYGDDYRSQPRRPRLVQ